MAAPKKRSAGGRSARSTSSRKAAAPRGGRAQKPEAEEPSEEGGIGWEGGAGIITFLILLAAVLLLDYDLGTKYPGEGIFFGGN